MDPALEKAYSDFRTARDALTEAMKCDTAVASREYYRSDVCRIDEAGREKLKTIAEQMRLCIKKRVPPSPEDLNRWSIILCEI